MDARTIGELVTSVEELGGESSSDGSTNTVSDGNAINIDASEAYSFLNVDLSDTGEIEMANAIYEWAKGMADSGDDLDVLWAIKDARSRIGTPPFERSELEHLYMYIKLDSESKDIKRKMELFER